MSGLPAAELYAVSTGLTNPTLSSATAVQPPPSYPTGRLCCQFVNRVEVKFLPVHHPTEEERANSTLYANNMQVPLQCTPHIFFYRQWVVKVVCLVRRSFHSVFFVRYIFSVYLWNLSVKSIFCYKIPNDIV